MKSFAMLALVLDGVHPPSFFQCCLSDVKAEHINSKTCVKSITSSLCVPVPKRVQFCPCQQE